MLSGCVRPAICGRYICRLAAAQSFESESWFSPSTRTSALSQPRRSADAIDVDDRAIAPASADVRPQRLTVAVREEARIGRELLDRRELVAHDGVAHPHRRERILAAEREVLGHSFDEPERKRVEAHQTAARRAFGDVVLEDVHELVAEHVVVVGVDAGERHDDARAVRLGDAARAFLELLADDVRLLEVRMVGVEDQATCDRTRDGTCRSAARTSARPCGPRR